MTTGWPSWCSQARMRISFLAHYDIAADQSAFNALPAARHPRSTLGDPADQTQQVAGGDDQRHSGQGSRCGQ